MRATIKGALIRFSVAALLAGGAQAATLTVNSGADAGGTCPGATCTLRQAIATAASGDTINFAPGLKTVTLTSAELLIYKNLTISGPGANLLSVERSAASGTPAFRIFDISAGLPVSVTISGLTIANGDGTGEAGGILTSNSGGTVTIAGCTISDNKAGNLMGSGGSGGGILHSAGIMTIRDSTISVNQGDSGGGIFNGDTMSIINCTIFGNSVGHFGGGIANNGTMTITSSTLCGNSAGIGGGLFNNGFPDGLQTINVKNTIIAQNTAPSGPDFYGRLTSQGWNLIGNTSGTTITGTTTGNQLNVDPKLETASSGEPLLKNNGGTTSTVVLLSGSTAIEGGNASGSTTDQRGLQRPVDDPTISNAAGGDGSDIGAYEVQGDQLPGCGNRVVTNNNDSGSGSLRFAIANICGGETITFASSVVSPITLTSAELLLNTSVTINGPGANLLSVQRSAASGTPKFRIFDITSNVIATISGLTIANGSPGFGDGGGISSTGTLTLTGVAISGNLGTGVINGLAKVTTINNSTISGNSGGSGGGIVNNGGTLTITNSTISGNMAILGGSGGGINTFGTLTLTNSTISANTAGAAGTGGGICQSSTGSSTVNARNSIIAGNTAAGGGPDFKGALTSQGFNFIGNSSGATITPAQFSDQIGTAVSPKDPLLDILKDNGGPTQTQALLSGSTAIDKGNSGGLFTDQRGFIRPVGFAAVGGGDGSDIGAFEVQAPTPTPTPTATPTPASTSTPIPTVTPTPTAAPSLVANVATRLPVGTDDNVLIEGFIVQGPTGSGKTIMVRALGPSLTQFGIIDALANPTLEIHDASNATVATNDNWRTTQVGGIVTSDQSAAIGASGLAPSNELESAIIANLNPGQYTAVVRGVGNSVGTGVVDAYDLSAASPARLANIATRGLIQPGDKLMIAGLIIQNGPATAVVRAMGPSLSAFGIANALADTTLQLRDQNGAIVRENDDWQTDQKQELESTGLQPVDAREAALIETIQPGQYTAQVRGKPEATGVGVVEVYFLQ